MMYFNRYKCPSCGNININIDTDNEVIMCDKCNLQMPVGDYFLQMELLEKAIMAQAIKHFIEPGIGLLVQFQNRYYIIGIDKEGQIIISQHELQEGEEVGDCFNIEINKQEE